MGYQLVIFGLGPDQVGSKFPGFIGYLFISDQNFQIFAISSIWFNWTNNQTNNNTEKRAVVAEYLVNWLLLLLKKHWQFLYFFGLGWDESMGKKKRQVDRVFCCATKLTNQLQWTETLNPANSAYLQLEESTLFSKYVSISS